MRPAVKLNNQICLILGFFYIEFYDLYIYIFLHIFIIYEEIYILYILRVIDLEHIPNILYILRVIRD